MTLTFRPLVLRSAATLLHRAWSFAATGFAVGTQGFAADALLMRCPDLGHEKAQRTTPRLGRWSYGRKMNWP